MLLQHRFHICLQLLIVFGAVWILQTQILRSSHPSRYGHPSLKLAIPGVKLIIGDCHLRIYFSSFLSFLNQAEVGVSSDCLILASSLR
jgi:hypothetical protein